jgi:cytochrome d ubiquinol oxidase subunit II
MFSGFYLALLLILVALIVRICAFEWRQKIDDPVWRNRWDWAHTLGAWIPSVLWGVAFANLVQGMHIEIIDGNHQLTGGFWSLITPFTLLGGVTTAALFLTHGAVFLALKTDGEIRERSGTLAQRLSIGSLLIAAVWAVWAQLAFSSNAFSWLPLVVAALALVGVVLATRARREGWAFALNAVAIAGAVALIFSIMYPNVMPSSLNPDWSLTIAEASSSKATLQVMSVVALVMVPIVLAYQGWTLWVFRQRLTGAHIGTATGLLPFAERSFEDVDR